MHWFMANAQKLSIDSSNLDALSKYYIINHPRISAMTMILRAIFFLGKL